MTDYVVAILLPQILHGLVYGAILALVAAGLSVVFGILGVMNFAHGELLMWGAYVGIAVVAVTRSFWLALVAAPLAVAVLGALVERGTLRPLYGRPPLFGLIATFGLAMILRELVQLVWGQDTFTVAPPWPGTVPLLGFAYPTYRLFVVGFAIALLGVLWLFVMRTRAGLLVRAAVQDPEMLDGLGVDLPRLLTWTVAGSAALAAVGGVVMAPIFTVYPDLGVETILFAFLVVILGGLGSIGGSIVAAFLIGEAQSLASLWLDPRQATTIIFALMILLLVVRPRGLFGKEGLLE